MTREQREYLRGFGMAGVEVAALRSWFSDTAERRAIDGLVQIAACHDLIDGTPDSAVMLGYNAGILSAFEVDWSA
jgi:hypothetical protein